MWDMLYTSAIECVLNTFPLSPVQQPIWTEAEEICSHEQVLRTFNKHLIKDFAVEQWRRCILIAQDEVGMLESQRGAQKLAEILTTSVKLLRKDAGKENIVVDSNPDIDSPGEGSPPFL